MSVVLSDILTLVTNYGLDDPAIHSNLSEHGDECVPGIVYVISGEHLLKVLIKDIIRGDRLHREDLSDLVTQGYYTDTSLCLGCYYLNMVRMTVLWLKVIELRPSASGINV